MTKLCSFVKTLSAPRVHILANQKRAPAHVNDASNLVTQNTHHACARAHNCSHASNHCICLFSVYASTQYCDSDRTSVQYLDMSDSVSSISSVPPHFDPESDFTVSEAVPSEATTFVTGPLIVDEAPRVPEPVDPPISPQLLTTIIAAVKAESKSVASVATETEADLAIDQFSVDHIRKLSAKDVFIQKLRAAIDDPEKRRVVMGKYWSSLRKDLHTTEDGCVFLDNRLVLPQAIRSAFLTYLHSSHAGARAMKSKAEYVWFPHMFKSIEAMAQNCQTCRQTGKNLACVPNVKQSAPRPIVTQSLDELELDFLGPLFQNPVSQHYVLLIAILDTRLLCAVLHLLLTML